ncbi:MAG: purine-nucleoside phosphorylase [Bacteroidales bacterium]|jgi:purine-nucleoside phosphorylase|nr:purine-nucleoside phosphorylase [Bacteroidales bacterium]
MLERIQKIAHFLDERKIGNPKVAIVLGSGLGGLTQQIHIQREIAYREIPGYPVSTVQGHGGTWIYGTLNGVEIVVLNGRVHYYEGYDMKEITLPIQVLKEIGIEKIILSNAAGGMNPSFKVGDIMIIKDHINLFGNNPLLGINDDRLGPRFLEMGEAYSSRLRKIAFQTAKTLGIHLQEGVYMGVSGPCYETPAEYRMFHVMGADAVGMSTVPETIVARYRGLEVFALSVITDLGVIGLIEKISHEEVLTAAAAAGPIMETLVCTMLPKI